MPQRQEFHRGNLGLDLIPPRPSKPNLQVKVRDFGPIARGEVELRPLTVFAGPSNTGKSWLAVLIYSMLKALPIHPRRSSFSSRLYTHFMRRGGVAEDLNKFNLSFFPEDAELWNNSTRDGVAFSLTPKESEFINFEIGELADGIVEEIFRCYGISDPTMTVRWGAKEQAHIEMRLGDISHEVLIEKRVNQVDFSAKYHPDSALLPDEPERGVAFLPKLPSPHNGIDESDFDVSEINDFAQFHNTESILRYLYMQGQIGSIHYLPADRGGVMHAHASAVSALIRSVSFSGLNQDQNTPVLSGVLSDFINNLVLLAEAQIVNESRTGNLDAGLNENVLSGTVDVESTIFGYPSVVYRPAGSQVSLPLSNASSMVSEIGPLALYLKHFVSPGDVLVLEEPEAHLHPKLQRKLMLEVVRWTKLGVRTIVTTHSDWIINELSSAVARGIRLDDQQVAKREGALKAEDVGMWRFCDNEESDLSQGSTIEEIPWMAKTAGYDAGFFDVLVDQNNEWAEIMDEVYAGGDVP